MNKVWKAWLSRSSDRSKPAIKLAYKLQKGRSDSFKTSHIEHVRDVAFAWGRLFSQKTTFEKSVSEIAIKRRRLLGTLLFYDRENIKFII